MLTGAVSTAIKDALRFHPMTDDPAATMGAGGCQGMDRAFETIKDMGFVIHLHFEALIVHVPAYFTSLVIPLLIHYLSLSLIHPFWRLELS
jgi:hypothetical protein